MAIIVTEPYSDYRYGSKSAVRVLEVSGVTKAEAARAACKIDKDDTHPENQDMVCDDWAALCVAPSFWRLTFSYSFPGDLEAGNPLLRPTLIQWSAGLVSEVFDRDINRTPIANSAGDPFDRPAEAGVPVLNFTCTRFEPSPFNAVKAVNFIGTVNKTNTKIAGFQISEGQCLLKGYHPLGQYTQNIKYLQVEYEFELRGQGFDFRVLDQGMQGWVSRGGRGGGTFPVDLWRAANTTRGEPPAQVTQSVRLDGTGKPFDPKKYTDGHNNPLVPNPTKLPNTVKVEKTGDAVFLTYQVYRRSNFSALGL